MASNNIDHELGSLLLMDGEIFPMDNGYWTKIEAQEVAINEHVPHGIKYSLTLHDRYNKRVLGFDNAHGVKLKQKRYTAKKVTWDHKHQHKTVENYEFESAGQLLKDFWTAVNQIMEGI